MNVWICIAYDPLPLVDSTTRLLRYGTLAEQLAANGHSVVLWTSTFDHWRKRERFDRDQTVSLGDGLRIEMLHAPSYARNVSWARIRHNRVLASRFRSRVEALPAPDMVFAGIPCLEFAEASAVYARKKRIPFVVDVQDVWPEVYVTVLPKFLRPFGRTVLRSEFSRARWILTNSIGLTAVSRQYLDWAQRIRGSTAIHDRVFPLGYRPPPAALLASAKANKCEFLATRHLPTDCTLVLFLGQFAASYDIETVVEAARLLESNDIGVHFALAGSGEKMRRVQRAARGLTKTTLTGWLDYQDTLTLLASAQIGLAAYSRKAPQSLPYKPFEYMAFGLPIISSLGGELRELIAEHQIGCWYQAGNARSLAASIVEMSASRDAREQASRRARNLFVSQFDATLITNRIIAYLEQVNRDAASVV